MSCYGCKYNSKQISEFNNWCKEPTFDGGTIVSTIGDCKQFSSALVAELGTDIEMVNNKKIISMNIFPTRKSKYIPIKRNRKPDSKKQEEARKYLMKCINDIKRRKK